MAIVKKTEKAAPKKAAPKKAAPKVQPKVEPKAAPKVVRDDEIARLEAKIAALEARLERVISHLPLARSTRTSL